MEERFRLGRQKVMRPDLQYSMPGCPDAGEIDSRMDWSIDKCSKKGRDSSCEYSEDDRMFCSGPDDAGRGNECRRAIGAR